jgi:hypothetical protein
MCKKIKYKSKAYQAWHEEKRLPEGRDQLLYYNLADNHPPFVTS